MDTTQKIKKIGLGDFFSDSGGYAATVNQTNQIKLMAHITRRVFKGS